MGGKTAGILLAAGAGTRMGHPKALVRHADGRAWVETALLALLEGGCEPVAIVVGAEAASVRAVLGRGSSVTVLENAGWPEGMGSSLKMALDWCSRLAPCVTCALVMLVDTPDVGAAVVRRVRAHGTGPGVLARASFGGRDHGHPVLLGRQHWGALRASARSDRGARHYLEVHRPHFVDCTGLGTGRDHDSAPGLSGGRTRPA